MSSTTDKDIDVESGNCNDGYPALAQWIAQDPDNETLIFRKFDGLGTRNLLYMQAELFDVERRVLEFERQISSSRDMDLRISIRRWETLVENANTIYQRPEQELMKLVKEMRVKVKEYRKCRRRTRLYKPD
jgi:hypothetical protein